MKVLYLDCFSGVSGDMFLSSLVSLGAPEMVVAQAIGRLLPDLRWEFLLREHQGVKARGFRVSSVQSLPRPLREIFLLIERADLSPWVKLKAREIFELLGQVEARVHGCSPEEVHLHELGAEDTIADVVGTLVALEALGRPEVISSPLPLARGFVSTAHGRLPLPAPATLEILKGVPTTGEEIPFEFVTPTGAALVKILARGFGPPPTGIPLAIGYGAGTKPLPDRPNILRTVLYQLTESEIPHQRVAVLETNIDDLNPQVYGFVAERLFAAGALDVVLIPLQMKKGRPGVLLKVIAPPDKLYPLTEIIFSETTTTGLRYYWTDRLTLPRKIIFLKTPWGKVRAKKILGPRETVRLIPEYEDCLKLAREKGVPLEEILSWARGRDPNEKTGIDEQ